MRTSRLQYEGAISSGVDFAASDLAEEPAQGLMRYVRTTDITSQRMLRPDGVYVPSDQVPSSARVRAGDLLLTRAGSVGTTYLHGGEDCAFAGYLVRFRAESSNEPRFFAYWARSVGFLDAVAVGAVRSTIDNFSGRKYGAMPVPVPPLEQQRRIADHLDTETARIDTLIAKNEHAAALAEERQVAAAEQRLGVFPRVPMWMVVELLPGYAYPSSIFKPSGEVRLLRGINVTSGQLRWNDMVYADCVDVQRSSAYALVTGDIVFGMDRPWVGSGVRAAMVSPEDEAEGPIRLVQRVLRIRVPRESLHPELLLAWMRTRAFYASFEPDMTGVSVPHVSAGQVGAVGVPVPPPEQQGELVRELGALERSAKAALERLGAQRDLLRERRQALITAAVTGEIEV